MVSFEEFQLKNGLKVIIHHDPTASLVAVNLLYDVGARDEDPSQTGFAHLFEHLMFGGSVNIPNYDGPLQRVGGQNNAFTSNDITNYYITLPGENLETALWLESDRMLSLDFSEKSLEVQRQVVIEEFRQRYLNQPYGDVWLHLRPLAYKVHPYRWATIGDVKHIEEATLDQVKDFFKKFYKPSNAILVVAGNVQPQETFALVKKWFDSIPGDPMPKRIVPLEPPQKERRFLSLEREVPTDALYMAFHMAGRKDRQFYSADLLSDVLSSGRSARLLNSLVKEKEIFSDIDASISGSVDPGLFIISGRLRDGISHESAEQAIWKELEVIKSNPVSAEELERVKNRTESSLAFSRMGALNKAMQLSYYKLLGDASLLNDLDKEYGSVSAEEMMKTANEIFSPENSSVLYYRKSK